MVKIQNNNTVKEVNKLGQSVWFDQIGRDLLQSGEISRLVDIGVSGLTSNPTIFEKAIANSSEYDSDLLSLFQKGKTVVEIFESITIHDIRAAADLLRPIFDMTSGEDGFVSYEVNPHLAYDTDGTIREAIRLYSTISRPNVMIKVPATAEGIPAISSLIGQGINVNITLIFSLQTYEDVRNAYIEGLDIFHRNGGDLSKVSSVASFFVSRVDTKIDSEIEIRSVNSNSDLESFYSTAAISNAKIAYRDFKETFGGAKFKKMIDRRARVQRPLWASTSTKNPSLSDVLYVDNLIGAHTVNTMPEVPLQAFLDHGRVKETIGLDLENAANSLKILEKNGIILADITAGLLLDGLDAFKNSYDSALNNIRTKKSKLFVPEQVLPSNE